MATKKIVPNVNEKNRLSCNSGDLIEITDVSIDGIIVVSFFFIFKFFIFNYFKGRLSHLPGITGKISADCIARTSDTLVIFF